MEAIRPAAQQPQPWTTFENHEEPSTVNDLPPPPTPFPAELIPHTASGPSHDIAERSLSLLHAVQQTSSRALSSVVAQFDQQTSPYQGQLAATLSDLVEACREVESLYPGSSQPGPSRLKMPSDSSLEGPIRQLQSLTVERNSIPRDSEVASLSALREDINWERLEALCRATISLLESKDTTPLEPVGNSPPSYTQAEESSTLHLPPIYQEEQGDTAPTSTKDGKASTPSTEVQTPQEKMDLEREGVMDAIERLHTLAPQLESQRMEMRSGESSADGGARAMARMERAKIREMEDIWDKIEKTHGKGRMGEGSQRVDVELLKAAKVVVPEELLQAILNAPSRMIGQDSEPGSVNKDLARARDLRERDRFLRDLIERSADRRLSNQEAEAPMTGKGDDSRRQKFLSDLVARTLSTRLDTQDYPDSVESRIATKRQSLINDIVSYSSSGRMHDQDSLPPTPRNTSHPTTLGDPREMVTVEDFFRSEPPPTTERRSASDAELTPSENGESRFASMRRLKGLVRRKSLGLGLKASPSMSNVSYAALHHENLHMVQVMLHGIGVPLKEELVIETGASLSGESTTSATISYGKDPSIVLTIQLPAPVYAGQLTSLVVQDIHLEAKLRAVPTSTPGSITSLNTVLTHALSAQEMRRIQPTDIRCAQCDRDIVNLPTTTGPLEQTYKDLPSEHWAEMMDVWMCHDDPAFTAKLAKNTKDGFWPNKGSILIGGSYFLVHGDDLQQSNVEVESSLDGSWSALRCTCGEPLGKLRMNDSQPGSGCARLYKWSLSLVSESDDQATDCTHYPPSVFILSDMLELGQAHASYRFTLTSEDDEHARPKVFLWLFNPSMDISFKRTLLPPPPSPATRGVSPRRRSAKRLSKPRPTSQSLQSYSANADGGDVRPGDGSVEKAIKAAKVFYKVVDELDPESAEQLTGSLPGFGPRGQVETMKYPLEVIHRLIATLEESNAVFPMSRRSMSGFDVGFLERF